VVEPLVSVITDVALDHQKYLGETIAEIAREKAGIIRPKGVVVTLPQHPEANDVIGNTILERCARGVSAVPFMPPVSPGAEQELEGAAAESGRAGNRYPLAVLGEEILVESPLAGRHQLRNLALAIAAAVELNGLGIHIPAQAIARGIRETRWPGRFQVEQRGGIDFVLDVAHNPAGAWALRSALSRWYPDRRIVFVFGAMRDKAVREMAEILFPMAESVIATQAENPRSAAASEVREAGARTGTFIECTSTVAEAIVRALSLPPGTVVAVTGSIYVVGEAMQALGVEVD
jgi:dihydrofolate synthase/folylpolyglutamate synthase